MNEAHSARIGLHVWSVLQTTTTGGTDEKSWGFYTRCSTVSKPSDRRVAQGDLEVGRVPALPRRDRSEAPAPRRRRDGWMNLGEARRGERPSRCHHRDAYSNSPASSLLRSFFVSFLAAPPFASNSSRSMRASFLASCETTKRDGRSGSVSRVVHPEGKIRGGEGSVVPMLTRKRGANVGIGDAPWLPSWPPSSPASPSPPPP